MDEARDFGVVADALRASAARALRTETRPGILNFQNQMIYSVLNRRWVAARCIVGVVDFDGVDVPVGVLFTACCYDFAYSG